MEKKRMCFVKNFIKTLFFPDNSRKRQIPRKPRQGLLQPSGSCQRSSDRQAPCFPPRTLPQFCGFKEWPYCPVRQKSLMSGYLSTQHNYFLVSGQGSLPYCLSLSKENGWCMCVCTCTQHLYGHKAHRHTLHSWLKFLPPHKEERLSDCLSLSSLPEMVQGKIQSDSELNSQLDHN